MSKEFEGRVEGDPADTENVPAVRKPQAELGCITGEVDMQKLPPIWLQMAHGVGRLFEAGFQPGDLVLNKDVAIAKRGDKLTVTVLAAVQFYRERNVQGGTPRTFNTLAEAEAAGLRTEWGDDPDTGARVGPDVSPTLEMGILIEKPANLESPYFGMEIDGRMYAMAKFSVDKDGYTVAGVPVITAGKYTLRGQPLFRGIFELTPGVKKTKNNRAVMVPYMRLVGKHPDEFVKAIANAITGSK